MEDFTVYLLDDDESVLKSLTRLLVVEGYQVISFNSPSKFLDAHDPVMPGCLLLDLLLPEMHGSAVQRRLQWHTCPRQIICMSGAADVAQCAHVMKEGAVDFLIKPIERTLLLDAIERAKVRDRKLRAQAIFGERLARLSRRERQVAEAVARGLTNKVIAYELGIVEKTVKVHRANAFTKLGVRSTAELVRIVIGAEKDKK